MPLTDTAVRNAKPYGKNYILKDMGDLSLLVGAKNGKSLHCRGLILVQQEGKSSLDMVASPKPPVTNNPFSRMDELPEFLACYRSGIHRMASR